MMSETDGDDKLANLTTPPHSNEAEQSLLGGIFLDASGFDEISDRVVESDFYIPEHQFIFEAMLRLVEKGRPIDAVTVSEQLETTGNKDNAGGVAYLTELVASATGLVNALTYSEIIRERSILRQLIQAAADIAKSARNTNGKPYNEILDEAESRIFNINQEKSSNDGPQNINKYLTNTMKRIDDLYKANTELTGLSTGFKYLDRLTAGLQPADLVVVAGRPSMGKTTFATCIVETALIKVDVPVLVFSMEMPGESLVMRMLSSLGRIDQTKVRTGRLSSDDWPRLTSAFSLLQERLLFIDDSASLTPTEMRSRARRVVRECKKPLGLIMVDYLQLMQVSRERENRANEISEISRSLKGLAKEMNCPVVALSQLNRSLESRPNKRPMMSDLRESGAIEQDADLICFIYRDEVYNEDSDDKGVAEIIIGKQRNGPIGTTRLAFLGQFTRFEDLAPNDYEDIAYG